MKASYIMAYGGSEVFNYGNLPDPELNEDSLIVEVKSASINPVDYKIKSGSIKVLTGSSFPRILGSDFSGIVVKTGQNISAFKPGDRVYGAYPIFFGKMGSMAELLNVRQKYVRRIPDGITFEVASSLPVAALTALNGLRKGGAGPGKRVLVNGATGGVGHFGVQIARAKGAYVTATCSKNNADFARSLGANEVLDYSNEELVSHKGKYDAIFDAYGKMEYEVICRLLNKGGVYASTLFMPFSFLSAFFVKIIFNKKLTSSNLRTLPEDFDLLEKMILENKVKPYIDKTFKLEDASAAFEYAEKGNPKGKVLISI